MFVNKFIGKKLTRGHRIDKTFSYAKNTATLKFTLDIENKKAMEDFLQLLEEAVAEVNEQIKEIK